MCASCFKTATDESPPSSLPPPSLLLVSYTGINKVNAPAFDAVKKVILPRFCLSDPIEVQHIDTRHAEAINCLKTIFLQPHESYLRANVCTMCTHRCHCMKQNNLDAGAMNNRKEL